MHMQLGSIPQEPLAWPPAQDKAEGQNGSQLLGLALDWLKEDRVLRKKAEESKGRKRGPKNDVRPLVLPLDGDSVDGALTIDPSFPTPFRLGTPRPSTRSTTTSRKA
jgi:hypothetical protein